MANEVIAVVGIGLAFVNVNTEAFFFKLIARITGTRKPEFVICACGTTHVGDMVGTIVHVFSVVTFVDVHACHSVTFVEFVALANE